MAKFVLKSAIYEAEQWFPGKDVPGAVLYQPPDATIGGRGHGEMRFPQEPYMAVTQTALGRVIPLSAGDWIIREPNGRTYVVCGAATFAERYEAV